VHVIGLDDLKPKHIGSFQVIPFKVPHSVPNCGYIIHHREMGNLLFSTDMEYIGYDLTGFDLNHILIESNYSKSLIDDSMANYKHKIQGHCAFETTLDVIKDNVSSDLQNVILVHLGSYSDPESYIETLNKLPGNFQARIAEPGLEIKLDKPVFG